MILKLCTLALTAALAVAAALAVTPALAQRAERKDKDLAQFCAGDYFRYCGNIAPDTPEVDQCFAKNWASLTPSCRTAIDSYEQKAPAKGRKS